MDDVAQTYLDRRLNEMSMRTKQSPNWLVDSESRKKVYNYSKDWNLHSDLGNGIIVVKYSDQDGNTGYRTLDDTTGECIHRSILIKVNGDSQFKFPYHYNDVVERSKHTEKLPKNFVTDFTYNNFKESDIPLVTSRNQLPNGHKMWRRMVDKALNDGHYVYYANKYDPLVPVTHENKEKYLNDYYGNDMDATKRHMVLSKTKLV